MPPWRLPGVALLVFIALVAPLRARADATPIALVGAEFERELTAYAPYNSSAYLAANAYQTTTHPPDPFERLGWRLYHGGERHPHLVRIDGARDGLTPIVAPHRARAR